MATAAWGKAWTLTLEVMQINSLDTRLWVNDQSISPPYLPTEDFSSVWVSVQLQVPSALLRAGHNTVVLRSANTIPAFQQLGSWDDLQLRNVVLHKP